MGVMCCKEMKVEACKYMKMECSYEMIVVDYKGMKIIMLQGETSRKLKEVGRGGLKENENGVLQV